mmetsp:Transcript_69254/g.192863  ORF Transcript_69254/g.192863 Transcript_69254/m.192863 type:complete len:214 (-) Transcript_69254:979-1620(-)
MDGGDQGRQPGWRRRHQKSRTRSRRGGPVGMRHTFDSPEGIVDEALGCVVAGSVGSCADHAESGATCGCKRRAAFSPLRLRVRPDRGNLPQAEGNHRLKSLRVPRQGRLAQFLREVCRARPYGGTGGELAHSFHAAQGHCDGAPQSVFEGLETSWLHRFCRRRRRQPALVAVRAFGGDVGRAVRPGPVFLRPELQEATGHEPLHAQFGVGLDV